MDARLHLRVQRYGWDRAAADYEALWRRQLAPARAALLSAAAIARGEAVLDVACGTGLVTLEAASLAGPQATVLGTDLSGEMLEAARRAAGQRGLAQVSFARMGAEELSLANGAFDVALCALGLMYVQDPGRAVRELRRVLRPGGRVALAVWGERCNCGWASVFPIVQAEVNSEVCPLFFALGAADSLAGLCRAAGFEAVTEERIRVSLDYRDGREAADAALVGGPVALAWSRFDTVTRARVRTRYLASLGPPLRSGALRIPGEFVIVAGRTPQGFSA